MQRLAQLLAEAAPISIPHISKAMEVCLHILERRSPHGGHTAMAVRWIKNDKSGKAHSVALLGQNTPLPNELRQAVEESGGHIYIADSVDSFLHRAAWLRALSRECASRVILHTDVDDVIGWNCVRCSGGPAVVVNRPRPCFLDRSFHRRPYCNCRGSELEQFWTRSYRGASKCADGPHPLEIPCHHRDNRSRMIASCSRDVIKVFQRRRYLS